MLKTYRIIPVVFILFLFGFTLITVAPVFAQTVDQLIERINALDANDRAIVLEFNYSPPNRPSDASPPADMKDTARHSDYKKGFCTQNRPPYGTMTSSRDRGECERNGDRWKQPTNGCEHSSMGQVACFQELQERKMKVMKKEMKANGLCNNRSPHGECICEGGPCKGIGEDGRWENEVPLR
jgi:hypothetical protein